MAKGDAEDSKDKPKADEKDNITKLTEIGQTIATMRGNPLVLIFYPDEGGSIRRNDVYLLENKLNKKLEGYKGKLDVWIHTLGGNPQASYLIAQLIRDYCGDINLFSIG